MRSIQTNYQVACVPLVVEEYLALIPIEDNKSKDKIINIDWIDKENKSIDKNKREWSEKKKVKADE